MRFLFLYLLLFASFANAIAQRTLKLYSNLDYSQTYNHLDEEDMELSFKRVSIGYEFVRNKRFIHAMEISFSPDAMPVMHAFAEHPYHDIGQLYGSFLYEIQKPFFNTNDLRSPGFKFLLGVGIQLYYQQDHFDPKLEWAYERRYQNIGTTLLLIPRLQYVINEHFSIDLNIKFGMLTAREDLKRIKSPAIPLSQQRTDNFETEFIPKEYNARLGIGYTF